MYRWIAAGCLVLLNVQGYTEPKLVGAADQHGGDANPLEFNISTIKRGRQLYTVHCVSCHGMDGRGDTEMREFLKTPPVDLTDEIWVYGGHDAALFDSIASGRVERDMPSFTDKLSQDRIWQVVAYLRYLGGQRP